MALSAKRFSLLFFMVMLSACGEQAEVIDLGPIDSSMGSSVAEPASTTETQEARQVVVPMALQGKYHSATITVQLPGMSEAVRLELPLDGTPQPTDYGTLLAQHYLPAFVVSGNTITSNGHEENNPALWVEWHKDGNLLFSGWLFRDHPTLNPIKQADHQLSLVGAK
jgi:hypothetical protein